MNLITIKNIENTIAIRDSDQRRINFYRNYINENNGTFDFYAKDNSYKDINTFLETAYPDIIERKDFISKMRAECNKYILPKKEFSWIKINDRNCFWVWLMVRDIRNENLPLSPIDILSDLKRPLLYDQNAINQVPMGTKERYDSIIQFFDSLHTDIKNIRAYLYHLKKRLQYVYHFSTSFTWLKKEDKNQCDWAWDYIKRSGIVYYNENFLIPISKRETYFTVIAAFDAWPAQDSDKKLFLIKMKKAWGQKKYRDEVSNKKLLNTYISQSAKEKSEVMTKLSQQKIHELIEKMIDNEYKKYQ